MHGCQRTRYHSFIISFMEHLKFGPTYTLKRALIVTLPLIPWSKFSTRACDPSIQSSRVGCYWHIRIFAVWSLTFWASGAWIKNLWSATPAPCHSPIYEIDTLSFQNLTIGSGGINFNLFFDSIISNSITTKYIQQRIHCPLITRSKINPNKIYRDYM